MSPAGASAGSRTRVAPSPSGKSSSPPLSRARGRRGSFQMEAQLLARHCENLSQRGGDAPGGTNRIPSGFGGLGPSSLVRTPQQPRASMSMRQLMDVKARALAWWADFKARRYMFHHHVWYINMWDWFLALFVLYSTTYTPFILVFPHGAWPGSPGLDVTLDLVFCFDVGIKLRTTYTDRGIEVLEPRKVKMHYMAG